MTHNISYFDRIDINRTEGLSNIENGLVKSFWKSTIINEESFSDIECDIVKEVLIEEYQEEILERQKNQSKRLTKLRLISALPEESDYVSVAYGCSSCFVAIKDVTSVNKHPMHSAEDVQLKYQKQKQKLLKDPNINNYFSIKKWVL